MLTAGHRDEQLTAGPKLIPAGVGLRIGDELGNCLGCDCATDVFISIALGTRHQAGNRR
jgi:hypothetical protein